MLNEANKQNRVLKTGQLQMIPNQFIPILIRYSLDDTFVIIALLEDHDINCLVPDEHLLTVHPFYCTAIGGVKVWVDRNDFDLAKSILISHNYITEVEVEVFRIKHDHNYKFNETYIKFRLEQIAYNVLRYPSYVLRNIRVFDLQAFLKTLLPVRNNYKSSSSLECPYCNSDNVYKPRVSREALVLTYLLTSIPIPFKTKKTFCFDCRGIFMHKK